MTINLLFAIISFIGVFSYIVYFINLRIKLTKLEMKSLTSRLTKLSEVSLVESGDTADYWCFIFKDYSLNSTIIVKVFKSGKRVLAKTVDNIDGKIVKLETDIKKTIFYKEKFEMFYKRMITLKDFYIVSKCKKKMTSPSLPILNPYLNIDNKTGEIILTEKQKKQKQELEKLSKLQEGIIYAN